MPKYLIDANLPFRVKIWHSTDFIHQINIGDDWTDEKIWNYAADFNLTIVTKIQISQIRLFFNRPHLELYILKLEILSLENLKSLLQRNGLK